MVVNYYNHATYKVIEMPNENALDGFKQIVNPEWKASSPLGWHSDGINVY